MKRNTITIIVISVVAILLIWEYYFPAKSPPLENIPVPINLNDYMGTVSTTTNGQFLYTNNKVGVRFTFPQGWHVGENSLGYGSLQLFNYDENAVSPRDSFAVDTKLDKIEAGIGSNTSYVNTEYPEKNRIANTLFVNGNPVTREDVEFSYGAKIRIYFIPLPHEGEMFLSISIAGDPNNFYFLDEIVQSVKWIK